MNDEDAFRRGLKIAGFLADEDVRAVLDELKLDAFQKFTSCEHPAELTPLWAQARALDSFEQALKVVVDSGEVAKMALERRERR